MRVVSTALLIMAFAGGTTFAQNPPAVPPHTAPLPVPIPLRSRPPIRPIKLSRKVKPVQPPQRLGARLHLVRREMRRLGCNRSPQGAPEQTVDPKK